VTNSVCPTAVGADHIRGTLTRETGFACPIFPRLVVDFRNTDCQRRKSVYGPAFGPSGRHGESPTIESGRILCVPDIDSTTHFAIRVPSPNRNPAALHRDGHAVRAVHRYLVAAEHVCEVAVRRERDVRGGPCDPEPRDFPTGLHVLAQRRLTGDR